MLLFARIEVHSAEGIPEAGSWIVWWRCRERRVEVVLLVRLLFIDDLARQLYPVVLATSIRAFYALNQLDDLAVLRYVLGTLAILVRHRQVNLVHEQHLTYLEVVCLGGQVQAGPALWMPVVHVRLLVAQQEADNARVSEPAGPL